MSEALGTTGLILNEPLLWERGKRGRCGFSMPAGDVPSSPLPAELTGDGPDFPDLSEIEVVRHYTRLSTWNFGVDTGLSPLGSCTMKYNPKINEKLARLRRGPSAAAGGTFSGGAALDVRSGAVFGGDHRSGRGNA